MGFNDLNSWEYYEVAHAIFGGVLWLSGPLAPVVDEVKPRENGLKFATLLIISSINFLVELLTFNLVAMCRSVNYVGVARLMVW